jgi:hypothetical protein
MPPRLRLPTTPQDIPYSLPAVAKQLPTAAGTPNYQAGVDQSQAGLDKQQVIDQARTMSSVPYMAKMDPAVGPSGPRSPEDQAMMQKHKEFAQQLQTAKSAADTRQNDLSLARNFLVATDPSADKSVRKFMLQGLSQATGVDPKGDYSKDIQSMVMGMAPPSLEALRSTFAKDIEGSAPGAIHEGLRGIFSGDIPIQNILARVQRSTAADQAVADAKSRPKPGAELSRMLEPAAPAGGLAAASQSFPGAAAPGGVTAATLRPSEVIAGAPSAGGGQAIAGQEGTASLAGGPGSDEFLAGGAATAPPSAAPRAGGEPATIGEVATPEAAPAMPPDTESAPPSPEPTVPLDTGTAAGPDLTAPVPLPEAPTTPTAATPEPTAPATAPPVSAPGVTDTTATAPPAPETPPTPPQMGVLEIPDSWRKAAEDSQDKLALDMIKKIDARNAVLRSHQATAPPGTPGAAPGAAPVGAGAAPADASATPTEIPSAGAGRFAQSQLAAIGPGPTALSEEPGFVDWAKGQLGKAAYQAKQLMSGDFSGYAKDFAADTKAIFTSPDVYGPPAPTSPTTPAQTKPIPTQITTIDGKTHDFSTPAGGQGGLTAQIGAANAAAESIPKLSPDKLQFVEPKERRGAAVEVDPNLLAMAQGFDKTQRYTVGQAGPAAKFPSEPGKQQDKVAALEGINKSAFESVTATTKIAEIIDRKPYLTAGTPKIPTPLGTIPDLSIGDLTEKIQRFSDIARKPGDQVGEDQIAGLANDAAKQAHLVAISRGIAEDSADYAALRQAYVELTFAKARNLNGRGVLTEPDVKHARETIGGLDLSTPANVELLRRNADEVVAKANRDIGIELGNSNQRVNWDLMQDDDRVRALGRNQVAAKLKILPDQTVIDMANASDRLRNGDNRPTLKPAGNTLDEYDAAFQRTKSSEEERKTAKEQRDIETHAQHAGTYQMAQETHDMNKERLQMAKDAAIEQKRMHEEQLARQARLEAKHDAERQQDRVTKAFQAAGHAIAGGIKGGVHLPAVQLGGGEDPNAFRIAPSPQRTPPRIPPLQLPRGTKFGG